MARQAEAGDISQRMHARQCGQLRAGRVELGGGGDHLRIAGIAELALFQCRGHHAHTQRLAQHQHVAWLCVGVALDVLGMHQPQRHQAVDGLDRIDGVATGNRDAGRAAYRRAAFEDAPDGLRRQHVDRHANQRQRKDRSAAHRIHIADRVGRGDAAEVVRVVDDGHEEVGGGNQRLLVVELVDRGIVGSLDAHQQFLGNWHGRHSLEDFRQQARCDLATAASAVRKRGQAGFNGLVRCVHRGPSMVVMSAARRSDREGTCVRAPDRTTRRGPRTAAAVERA